MTTAVKHTGQVLCYEDLCELSRLFNSAANLGLGQHYRINEALKDALERAWKYHPHEAVQLEKSVSDRKPKEPSKWDALDEVTK